jgi:hypothetical protein
MATRDMYDDRVVIPKERPYWLLLVMFLTLVVAAMLAFVVWDAFFTPGLDGLELFHRFYR